MTVPSGLGGIAYRVESSRISTLEACSAPTVRHRLSSAILSDICTRSTTCISSARWSASHLGTRHDTISRGGLAGKELGRPISWPSPFRADDLGECSQTNNAKNQQVILLSGTIGTGGITRIVLRALISDKVSHFHIHISSCWHRVFGEAGMLCSRWLWACG